MLVFVSRWLVPLTGHCVMDFQYQFLAVPVASNNQDVLYFAIGFQSEMRAVISPWCLFTDALSR